MTDERGSEAMRVGPVLEASDAGRAVAAAIRELNAGATVEDRGAYLRVSAPNHCVVTRGAIERAIGRPFELPLDLESLMPAFRGFLQIDAERIEWSRTRP
jgi:hypothetical protein